MKIYNQEKRIFEEKEYVETEDTGLVEIIKGVQCRKKNGYVTLMFNSNFVFELSKVWERLFILPPEFIPANVIFCTLFQNDLNARAIGCYINPNGDVNFLAPFGTYGALGTVTYPI